MQASPSAVTLQHASLTGVVVSSMCYGYMTDIRERTTRLHHSLTGETPNSSTELWACFMGPIALGCPQRVAQLRGQVWFFFTETSCTETSWCHHAAAIQQYCVQTAKPASELSSVTCPLSNSSLIDAVFLQSFEADDSRPLAEDAPPVVWIHAASAGKHFLAMVIMQRCLEASGFH